MRVHCGGCGQQHTVYSSTRGRGEVLGQAGAAEAYAYTLEGVSKNQKSKITSNSSNSTTALPVPIFPPSPE